MLTARAALAVGVINGILYAVGGDDCYPDIACPTDQVEAYDPVTNTWTTKTPMPTGRGEVASGVINGILYVIGGISANGYLLDTVEAYNPATDSWATKTSMPKERAFLAAGVIGGILYAVGGVDCTNYPACSTKDTLFAYDPATDAWTEKASMRRARKNLAVGVINGILYVVGGNNYRGLANTVQAYDPATNSWTARASLPRPREGVGVEVINGRLLAVGGCRDRDCRYPMKTVEAYDPATNNWTAKAPLPTARGFLAVGVVGGILYAVGGSGNNMGNPWNKVEAFTPQ